MTFCLILAITIGLLGQMANSKSKNLCDLVDLFIDTVESSQLNVKCCSMIIKGATRLQKLRISSKMKLTTRYVSVVLVTLDAALSMSC